MTSVIRKLNSLHLNELFMFTCKPQNKCHLLQIPLISPFGKIIFIYHLQILFCFVVACLS